MRTVVLSRSAACRFLIDAFGLRRFQSFQRPADVIEKLEFVQEDSINVCGRMHDLILWPRVAGYAVDGIHSDLYGASPAAFEAYFPNLCALPAADYAYFRPEMQRRAEVPGRWHGLLPEEEPVAEALFERIRTEGPLRTRNAGSEHGRTTSGWGTGQTVAAFVANKLWLHGRLAICGRDNFEKVFDLPERVHPEFLAQPEPEEASIAHHLARKRLRARRLFRPNAADRTMLGRDAFVEVRIDGVAKPWFALAEDADRLDAAPEPTETHLIAPLDPLVYDRQRTLDLFDFDYRWEVYTPEAKRVRGYYALPILQGERIVGWIDPKVDRKRRVLCVSGLAVDASAERRAIDDRIARFAAFLGADAVA